jgi:hypothetical protein
VVRSVRSFEAARAWEIEQERRMTPEVRPAFAKALRDWVHGPNPPDVRESKEVKIIRIAPAWAPNCIEAHPLNP